jgi:hypothetical protein
VPGDRIKVRELIRLYVADQVERFNSTPAEFTTNLQSEEERILNSRRPTKHTQHRSCDVEYENAVSAFSSNGFFLLVNGHQVSDLEEDISVKSDMEISFLRLTPLIGG